MKTCPDCNGEGVIEKGTDDEQQCPRCGGSGFVPDDEDDDEVTRTVSSLAAVVKDDDARSDKLCAPTHEPAELNFFDNDCEPKPVV